MLPNTEIDMDSMNVFANAKTEKQIFDNTIGKLFIFSNYCVL